MSGCSGYLLSEFDSLFGDVPYSTVPVLDMTTFSSSRVDRDEIYDGIIADLQEAVEVLPWYSEGFFSTPERISKNAAYGLLARTALYAAGYALHWDLNTYDNLLFRCAVLWMNRV